MTAKKSTIRTRLFFYTFSFCLNMMIVGGISYYFTNQLARANHELGTVSFPAMSHLTLVDMVHDGVRAAVFDAILAAERGDATVLQETLNDFAEFKKDIDVHLTALEKLPLSEKARQDEQAVKAMFVTYVNEANNIFTLATAGKIDELNKSLPAFTKVFKTLEKELEKMGESVEGESNAIVESSETTASRSQKINLMLMFAGITIALINGAFVTRRIVNDLTLVAERLTSEAKQLTTSASSINVASQRLSEATTEQAAAIEETVASMEQMSSMITQTALNAKNSSSVSEQGTHEAETGKETIGRMMHAMEDIDGANKKLENISKLIVEIGNKTKVINDIVFETRLLSFNASIEAARAGIHGKGFAVVADEVGKLATMSGKAADEIRQLLDSSIGEVTGIVSETRDRIGKGKTMSHQCESAFNVMGETLDKISQSVTLIATASKEQEAGVRQTNRAMSEMDKVTQVNSQSAESLAMQSSALDQGAKRIAESIAMLQSLLVRGANTDLLSMHDNNHSDKHSHDTDDQEAAPRHAEKVHAAPAVAHARTKARRDNAPRAHTSATASATQRAVAKPAATAPHDPSEVSRDDSRWAS